MVVRLFAYLAVAAFGMASAACNQLAPPPPGQGLTDGCYYAGSVAVLKVQGHTGALLIPGNIKSVEVIPDASADQAGVTFTPGFHLRKGPPLTAVGVTDLQSSSMMMKPYTDHPTIMAPTEPLGLIDLVRGTDC